MAAQEGICCFKFCCMLPLLLESQLPQSPAGVQLIMMLDLLIIHSLTAGPGRAQATLTVGDSETSVLELENSSCAAAQAPAAVCCCCLQYASAFCSQCSVAALWPLRTEPSENY